MSRLAFLAIVLGAIVCFAQLSMAIRRFEHGLLLGAALGGGLPSSQLLAPLLLGRRGHRHRGLEGFAYGVGIGGGHPRGYGGYPGYGGGGYPYAPY